MNSDRQYRVTQKHGINPNLFFAWFVEYLSHNGWREVRNLDTKTTLIKLAGGMADRQER